MGVTINGDIPKWIVYKFKKKQPKMDDFSGYPYFPQETSKSCAAFYTLPLNEKLRRGLEMGQRPRSTMLGANSRLGRGETRLTLEISQGDGYPLVISHITMENHHF